jgi:hypothetical protein
MTHYLVLLYLFTLPLSITSDLYIMMVRSITTTLFYTDTDPTDSRVELAHYSESLAAHSFFRVQLPTKKKDSRPTPSYTNKGCKPHHIEAAW